MDKNLITIIIATFNRSDLIEKAVNSVLDQSFLNWELLILDDNSTDDTGVVISHYLKDSRIKYIKNPKRLGVSGNRNLGLRIARGEYIAILDSDDVWLDKTKLMKQYEILIKNNDVGLVGTFAIKRYPDGKEKYTTQNSDSLIIRNNMLMKNQFIHSSVMYKKNLAIDGYDESLGLAEDWDLYLRIGQKSKLLNIPEYLTQYFVNPDGESVRKKIKMALIVDKLIQKYKSQYPNYFLARIKSYIRIFLVLIRVL